MNRNPLPRGRGLETTDWLVDFLKFLPPTTGSCGVPSVRMPLTLSLRHSRPHTWYFSPRRGGVIEQPASTDSEEIIARFLNEADAEAAKLDLDGQVDVVAIYICSVRVVDAKGKVRIRTRTEYFDEDLLRDFLAHRATKRDGIVQVFVVPTGSKSNMVRARFVGSRLATVETCTNVHYITGGDRTLIERAATFDGEEHLSRTNSVPSNAALSQHLTRLMREVITHVQEHIPDTYAIAEATAYFRVHADSKLYFLYCPSVVLMHKEKEGNEEAPTEVANASQVPLSPRVTKPVLAYSGSLPRDYFRCPCCGSVKGSVDRAQVPFRMVLQHLEFLDGEDGTMDGDAPELRAIATTLDKVSRNPQYYAELYRAAAKSNPASNVAKLLQECGYPGGDLELDDKLESPAELICFRLLQLAVTGTLAGDSKGGGGYGGGGGGGPKFEMLSIAHYKWVRDNKPDILQKVRVFVCSNCSLAFSSSLEGTHKHSATAALTADSSVFDMSALEKFQLRDPLGYKNYLKEQEKKREAAFLASIMSAKKAKGAAKASPFGALFQKPAAAPTAPPSPPPPRRDKPGSPRGGVSATVVDTRTEAEMRRALSLPLLIPKKDRKKLMQQRPWRVDKNDDELIAARKPRPISEEPRFSEVGALRGEMPSPDPRYLPSLQAKEEKRSMEKRIIEARELAVQIRESNRHQLNQAAERRARAAAREAAEAALAPSSWEAADLGDGPFLTQSRSAPHLKRHSHLAPGLRPPGRLPPMSLMSLADELGAAADAAAPDVLKSHRRAVRDVAADHGSLDAQLAALSERMHALEPAMKPIQQKAAQREGKLLSLTANAVLNSALAEIRAKLIANMPRVMDLFRKFDKNGDGLIARSEFVQVLPMLGLPQYGAAEMEGMFDVLDADRSGTLDFHEMDRLLRRGADVQLAAALQVGAKGVIEVEARNRYSVREHARDGALQPQKDSSVEAMRAAMIRQAARVTDFFKHLDINSDGKVSKPEFRAALPLLGFGAGGIPAMDKLFEQLDVDGNGYVEYSELKVALRRDDIELAAPLQDGALGVIEVKAKNAIELRNVHGD